MAYTKEHSSTIPFLYAPPQFTILVWLLHLQELKRISYCHTTCQLYNYMLRMLCAECVQCLQSNG